MLFGVAVSFVGHGSVAVFEFWRTFDHGGFAKEVHRRLVVGIDGFCKFLKTYVTYMVIKYF